MIELAEAVPGLWPPLYPYDPEANLVLRYDMQSGGVQLIDHSGKGSHCALVGVSSAAAPVGLCARFDGIDDYGTITGDIVGAGDVTISAWVKAYTWASGSCRILDNGKFIFWVQSGRSCLSSNGTATAAKSAAGSFGLNAWVHLVGVRKSDGLGSCYVNGVLSGAADQATGTPGTSSDTMLGNRTGGTDRPFDGWFGDVRLYKRIFTPVEIAELYRKDAWRFEVAG